MARSDPAFDRHSWSLKEHCDYANAQMSLKEIDESRRRKGLAAVHWVVRDNRVALEPVRTIQHAKPLAVREIANMPVWLRELGLRVGFLTERDGKVVDSSSNA